jgi:phosphotransferase system enzyme I (PtsI)
VARTLRGIGVSPGVAIGRVYLVHAEQLPVVPDPIPAERVHDEIERFEHARDEVRERLRQLRQRVLGALGDHYAGILDAQLMILDDPSLGRETIQRIRVGRVSALWAL